MIHGYVVVNGQKYFCGSGNTKRTAVACAEGNARMVGNEIDKPDLEYQVTYSSLDTVQDYPNITELV